jgi:hypothetical protein
MVAQALRPLDAVVVGQGEEVHPTPAESGVDLVWIAITFPAKLFDERGSALSRVVRVDVHIALHAHKRRAAVLRRDDAPAKPLKRLALSFSSQSFPQFMLH